MKNIECDILMRIYNFKAVLRINTMNNLGLRNKYTIRVDIGGTIGVDNSIKRDIYNATQQTLNK